jgi:uncharacterized protein (TIGR02996 family)
MNEAAFLSALHDSPNDEVTWAALADWLEEDGQTQRAELVRLVRQLRTVPFRRRTRERAALEARMAELLTGGVRPVTPEITNSIGMRFALIPPGTFRMGAPTTESGRRTDETAHEVELTRAFYLGVFPVTQRQYVLIHGNNPSAFCASGRDSDRVRRLDTSEFPVDHVSWQDAQAFVQALNARPDERGRTYRLPSETEWEYACRGGSASSGPFHLGDTILPATANFNTLYPYRLETKCPTLGRTCAVGSYPSNAFGLYDMHGNVWELCADWHGEYPADGVTVDPAGPATGSFGSFRVIRGGSWGTYGRYCRSAARGRITVERQYNFVGFRVALDVA